MTGSAACFLSLLLAALTGQVQSELISLKLISIVAGVNISRTLQFPFPGDYERATLDFCSEHEMTPDHCFTIMNRVRKVVQERDYIKSCQGNGVRKMNALNLFLPTVPEGCGGANPYRILIVHLSTARAHWSASHAQAINQLYAMRHGYEFIAHTCPLSIEELTWSDTDQVRANWCKPLLIAQQLERYHFVMMLDSDAYIIDPSYRIEQFIEANMPDGVDIVTPRNCVVDHLQLNGTRCWDDQPGVMSLNIALVLVRSTARAIRLMQEWYDSAKTACRHLAHPQWQDRWRANDQACLSQLYHDRKDYQEATRVLSPYTTIATLHGYHKAWIKHWMGGFLLDKTVIGVQIKADLITAARQVRFMRPIAHSAKKSSWIKHARNPVFGGGQMGVVFDISIMPYAASNSGLLQKTMRHLGPNIKTNEFCSSSCFPFVKELSDQDPLCDASCVVHFMYFSWRSARSIAFAISFDNGVCWSWDDQRPMIALEGRPNSWESDVNRPFVLHHGHTYKMWYTGQILHQRSSIGYAESADGVTWRRMNEGDLPVLQPEYPWEKNSIMCSHVIVDPISGLYRMWYSAGDMHEPDAIGHAVSCDGRHWKKTSEEPIFIPDPEQWWESSRVTCPSVIYNGEYYYMFYIGFADDQHASIGIARSPDGISRWERNPNNPVLRPSADPLDWDSEAVYKPVPVFSNGRWSLWYNGRKGSMEQIGLAMFDGHDLGFDDGKEETIPSRAVLFSVPIKVSDGSAYSLPVFDDENPMVTSAKFINELGLGARALESIYRYINNAVSEQLAHATTGPFAKFVENIGSLQLGPLMSGLMGLHLLARSMSTERSTEVLGFHPQVVEVYMRVGGARWVHTVCQAGFSTGYTTMALLFGQKDSKFISFESMNSTVQLVSKNLLETLYGLGRFTNAPYSEERSRCDVIDINGVSDFQSVWKDLMIGHRQSSCGNVVIISDVYHHAGEGGPRRLAWERALDEGLIEQVGCYEFTDPVLDIWAGDESKNRRSSFCIGHFVQPSSRDCEKEDLSTAWFHGLNVLRRVNFPRCSRGLCVADPRTVSAQGFQE